MSRVLRDPAISRVEGTHSQRFQRSQGLGDFNVILYGGQVISRVIRSQFDIKGGRDPVESISRVIGSQWLQGSQAPSDFKSEKLF